MSLRIWVEKTEAELGIFGQYLEAHLGIALTIVQGIDTALKNPVVDGVLEVVLPPAVSAHIPQVTAMLDKAITDLMAGTSIEKDLTAAATTEAKVKIFLTDLQAYNLFLKHALLQKLLSRLLAAIDNNALTEVLYDTYAQVKYALSKK